ncbi:MAG: GAK system CofD-like protein [Thermodesulfobacteriota bacterium]
MPIKLTRTIRMPDPFKMALYERSPDLGPRVLFFSGGSALREVSQSLIRYTHNSIHLITPFDSGGSSARLRDAFRMPAVGDVRNRLLALADTSLLGHPEILDLFSHRLSEKRSPSELAAELDRLIAGHHYLIAPIPDPMRKIIRNHLFWFRRQMPPDFDLRKASIGNLILTAGYLQNRKHLDPVIYIFSKLVEVRGVVRPVVNTHLHLVSELEDGQTLVGQHLLTAKGLPPISARVRRIYLSSRKRSPRPAGIGIRSKTRALIESADLICYPFGSFYSSLVANLLPEGVGAAIARVDCPKVFVPNTFEDPEQLGMSLEDQVNCLVEYLRRDDPGTIKPENVLNFVLLDRKNAAYPGTAKTSSFFRRAVQVIDTQLVTDRTRPKVDPLLLIERLLSFT